MKTITLTSEELRDIIKGVQSYRRCPDCNGEGIVYFKWKNENQEGLVDYISAQEFADWNGNPDQVGYEPCENCEEVGYIPIE